MKGGKARDRLPPEEYADYFPEEKLPDLAIFVALASAGIFVTQKKGSVISF